jgi:CRP/FNR family transcriptional regulator, dissimilatory nitrate respiration regulator
MRAFDHAQTACATPGWGAGLSAGEAALVRRAPLLAGLGEERLCELLAGSFMRRAGRGALLYGQGEEATRLYLVLGGWVRLFRGAPDGQDSTVALLGPGESAGELAILNGGRYLFSAAAATEARLLHVPASGLAERLRSDPELGLNLMAVASAHLRRLALQVERLTHRSSAQRVAALLVELCSPGREGRAEVELPLGKVLIAAQLGMQPETFSRSLAKLREYGVETVGNRVVVGNVGQLRAICGTIE